MNRADLHKEYARVIEMCEGTTVNPEECISHEGERGGYCCDFTDSPEKYAFAITIEEK